MGKVKPAVLPVPVCAEAKTSLPSKMGGIAFCCIGEGVVYPFLLMAFNKASDNPNELNDINGVSEVNTIYFECFFNWAQRYSKFFDCWFLFQKLRLFKHFFVSSSWASSKINYAAESKT